jgi:hypothetical protein
MTEPVDVVLPKLIYRKVERRNGEEWEVITFDLLKKGDLFKLYDPTGEGQVETGEQVYIATSDAEPYGPPEQCNYMVEADNANPEKE